MMRSKLAKVEGERKKFRAMFSKLGKKVGFKGYSEQTILLTNVVDAETSLLLTDHVWFSFSKSFQQLCLMPGAFIEFEARVKTYKKGYVNKQAKINRQKSDFKLSHPTNIKIFVI